MKTEQKIWVEDIISSADGVEQAQADGRLFAGIRKRLHTQVVQLQAVPMRTVWMAAAGFVLLVALNFFLLNNTHSPKMRTVNSPLTENSFDIYINS